MPLAKDSFPQEAATMAGQRLMTLMRPRSFRIEVFFLNRKINPLNPKQNEKF
jgi:hypothetical protein